MLIGKKEISRLIRKIAFEWELREEGTKQFCNFAKKHTIYQGWPDFFAHGPNFENIFHRGPQIFYF